MVADVYFPPAGHVAVMQEMPIDIALLEIKELDVRDITKLREQLWQGSATKLLDKKRL